MPRDLEMTSLLDKQWVAHIVNLLDKHFCNIKASSKKEERKRKEGSAQKIERAQKDAKDENNAKTKG
jgi:hypothetical protein